MTERRLLQVLLVRALEESDREGRFVPRRVRERATAEARREADVREPDEPVVVARFLERRARSILEQLGPDVARVREWIRLGIPSGAALLAVLVALGAGIAGDPFAGGRRIDLLSLPLLGLVGWNVAVYAALAARAALPGPAAAPGAGARIAEALIALRLRLSLPPRRQAAAAWKAEAAGRFLTLWAGATRAIQAARGRRLLHLGAAALAAGAIGGLYLRGLVLEYRATWESTFLDAEGAYAVTRLVLGPAAFLLGRPLPDREELAAIRSPADGPGAPWIHLWSATIALVVVAPRLALAAAAWRRERSLGRDLAPPSDGYVLRLLAAERGERTRVDVHPYSYRVSSAQSDRVRELLQDLFGMRAAIAIGPPVAYGEAEEAPGRGAAATRHRVALFNLAQTPEGEVHGRWLGGLRDGLAGGGTLLVLLDPEPYRDAGAERIEARRRAWERLGREHGLRVVTVPAETRDGVLDQARDALWPEHPGDPR